MTVSVVELTRRVLPTAAACTDPSDIGIIPARTAHIKHDPDSIGTEGWNTLKKIFIASTPVAARAAFFVGSDRSRV